MRRLTAFGSVVALVLCTGSASLADTIIFNNGDQLTGTITSMEKGKLVIHSDVAGDTTVDLKEVKTFSTDAPIKLHLNDGTIIDQKVAAGDAGEVKLEKGGTLVPQSIPLNQVEAINPKRDVWSGSVALGGAIIRGNTDSDQLALSIGAERRGKLDRVTLNGGYFYSRQRDGLTGPKTVSQDNWFAFGQYDYFFKPKWYGYGNARVEKDNIANLNLRFTPGVGVGYQWSDTDELSFSTEGGLSWVYEDYSTAPSADENISLRLAYHLNWKINDRLSLFSNLAYLPSIEDFGDYLLIGDIGLRVPITKHWFGELKVSETFDSTPAPGAYQNDTRYIVAAGYQF